MRIRFPLVIIALGSVLTLGSAETSLAQFGAPLTPQQVVCEAQQLRRLQSRAVARQFESTIFLWRASPAGGNYRGVVVSNGIGRVQESQEYERFERQMAFDLLLRADEDFLNPRRALLPQATLVRRTAGTNFDDRTGSVALDLSFDLASHVPNPFFPTNPLRLDVKTDGRGQKDGADRGISVADLTSPCHTELTAFDQGVFSILARTLRGTFCLAGPVQCGSNDLAFRAILYRGEVPLTYRAEFFEYGQTSDDDGTIHYGEAQITLEFRLQVSANGQLLGGDVRILPQCELGQVVGCSSFGNPHLAMFVLPPIRAGVEQQDVSVFRRGAYLFVDFFGRGDEVLSSNVNWADLLRGTAWGEPQQ